MKKQGIYSHKKPGKLLDHVRDVMRPKHYSVRTERSYIRWIKLFIFFTIKTSQGHSAPEVEVFLICWNNIDVKWKWVTLTRISA